MDDDDGVTLCCLLITFDVNTQCGVLRPHRVCIHHGRRRGCGWGWVCIGEDGDGCGCGYCCGCCERGLGSA